MRDFLAPSTAHCAFTSLFATPVTDPALTRPFGALADYAGVALKFAATLAA
jgi:hypothetical protein